MTWLKSYVQKNKNFTHRHKTMCKIFNIIIKYIKYEKS